MSRGAHRDACRLSVPPRNVLAVLGRRTGYHALIRGQEDIEDEASSKATLYEGSMGRVAARKVGNAVIGWKQFGEDGHGWAAAFDTCTNSSWRTGATTCDFVPIMMVRLAPGTVYTPVADQRPRSRYPSYPSYDVHPRSTQRACVRTGK